MIVLSFPVEAIHSTPSTMLAVTHVTGPVWRLMVVTLVYTELSCRHTATVESVLAVTMYSVPSPRLTHRTLLTRAE